MNATDNDPFDPALDAALEQELRGEAPPDLVDRVLARTTTYTPPSQARRSARLLQAALVLFAATLVALVWFGARDTDRSADTDDVVGPAPLHFDLVVPRTIDDARTLLATTERLRANVFALREPTTGRLVAIQAHPFENLLGTWLGGLPEPWIDADDATRARWIAHVDRALAGRSVPAAAFVTRPLELQCRIPGRGTLVVGIDDAPGAAVLQVRGLGVAFPLRADDALVRELRDATAEAAAKAVAARGLVLDRRALDALPPGTTRIRAIGLDADALASLGRFADLTTLDVAACATPRPDVVAAWSACPKLGSVTLPAIGVGTQHLAAVATLPALHELFVGAVQFELMVRTIPAITTAPSDVDDTAIAALTAATGLRDLWLPTTRITDAGLATLAALPLRHLTIGSPYVTGTGFAAFDRATSLDTVGLVATPRLSAPGLRSLGALPLRELVLVDAPLPAVALPAIEHVRSLALVDCRPDVAWPLVLRELATGDGPEKLHLTIGGTLTLDALGALAGSPRLKSLDIALHADAIGATEPDPTAALRAALPGVRIDLFRTPR